MEKLNSLGSSLPPEQPPTNQVIDSLSSDLSQEFKIAANAVTKLYRVANERNSLLKHQGYLNCIDDLLSHMEQGSNISVDDLHLWCLKQKNDILSHKSFGTSNSKFDFNFDNPHGANTSSSEVSVPKFQLSTPPLSVEHHHGPTQASNTSHNHLKPKKVRSSAIKKQHAMQAQQESWRPVKRSEIQRYDQEESRSETQMVTHMRPYVDSSQLSATKKQKAMTQLQTSPKAKK